MEKHTILEGKVRIYRRPNTKKWHCAARIHGKNIRRSTNETQLGKAEKVAEDWYFSLRGGFNPTANIDIKELPKEKTFIDAAETFVEEYDIQTKGERNPVYARTHGARIKNHLQPFFGGKLLSEINTGLIQQRCLKRSKSNRWTLRKSGWKLGLRSKNGSPNIVGCHINLCHCSHSFLLLL